MSRLFEEGAHSPVGNREANDQLGARLPELRSLPGFPDGTDADILRMSLAPSHTACPNPFVTDWLKETDSSTQTNPYKDPGPFTSDISEGKSDPIYKAHPYMTKVPHKAIMRYLLHYTRPGDVVLDGFCGTGMTGVAAQACGAPTASIRTEIESEMGSVGWGYRRAILQDLSPVATFIAAGVTQPLDSSAFDEASERILNEFYAEWGWMFSTLHGDRPVEIDYMVWSEVFTCPQCGGEVVFYEVASDEATGKVRDTFRCPNSACGVQLTRAQLERRYTQTPDGTGRTIETLARHPVRVQYRIGKEKFFRPLEEHDHAVLNRIEGIRLPAWTPSKAMPYLYRTKWLRQHKLQTGDGVAPIHFHCLRSALAISALWEKCEAIDDPRLRAALLFWVEPAIWGLSWMNRYVPRHYSHVNQYLGGIYYIPALISECSVRYNLEGTQPSRGKRRSLTKMWATSPSKSGQVMVSTGSSSRLLLPDASVDYVFVDPPFGENFYYGDLNYLTEAWHGVTTHLSDEAIVSKSHLHPRSVDEYQELMRECFSEFFRVLKPGRWMTIEFSNSSNEVWLAIQEALSAAGFIVADTRVFDKQQHSFSQTTAKNAVKQDLIISCYKPADELEDRFSLVSGSDGGAWEFIQEHLRHLETFDVSKGELRIVRERQADRLYDRMVAFHVHHGVAVPLTAAEFYSGLDQRFPVRDDMYFLPEQVEAYERKRMTIKELAQTELFITNEASAILWLRQQLKRKPQTFSQIQPPFFDELQAGPPEWEELPDLRQILDENFLQDEKDRWYVPDPRKASDLEKVRTKSLLREFARYVETKGKLERFRSEAVRAGFRAAWAERDYPMIISVGNRLPEDAFAEDQSLQHYYNNAKQQAR